MADADVRSPVGADARLAAGAIRPGAQLTTATAARLRSGALAGTGTATASVCPASRPSALPERPPGGGFAPPSLAAATAAIVSTEPSAVQPCIRPAGQPTSGAANGSAGTVGLDGRRTTRMTSSDD